MKLQQLVHCFHSDHIRTMNGHREILAKKLEKITKLLIFRRFSHAVSPLRPFGHLEKIPRRLNCSQSLPGWLVSKGSPGRGPLIQYKSPSTATILLNIRIHIHIHIHIHIYKNAVKSLKILSRKNAIYNPLIHPFTFCHTPYAVCQTLYTVAEMPCGMCYWLPQTFFCFYRHFQTHTLLEASYCHCQLCHFLQ